MDIQKRNGTAEQGRPKPVCATCGKTHKTENCWDGANAANDPRKKRTEYKPQQTAPNDNQTSKQIPEPKN